MKTKVAFFLMGALLLSVPLQAQWVKVPPAKVPRTPDGKPNLSAPAPKLPDGKPDLSGIWEALNNRYVQNIAADLKPEDVPYHPWAKALFDERKTGAHSKEDQPANCLPQGVPRIDAAPAPWKLVQTPGFIVVVYEAFNLWRQIFLDGREVATDAPPSWLGYSTAAWQGDTLVVDTKGFNGKAWIDQLGRPSTEALHVIERFRRKDFGHMEIQITIDDPKAYTKPWSVTEQFRLLPDAALMEEICQGRCRMDDLHRVRLSALPGSIVHDCGARLDGVGEHGRVRYGLPMMRDDPQIDSADAILRAHQVEFLVPGEIAEMQHPKFSKSDVASDRLRILGLIHFLRREAGTVWIRLSCARRAR